jgi:hypothetical protein
MNDSATTFGPKETTADDTMIDETMNETSCPDSQIALSGCISANAGSSKES